MSRLPRPNIPVKIKLTVALAQFLGVDIDLASKVAALVVLAKRGKRTLDATLREIAKNKGCESSDLRLDHDPPLGAREKIRSADGAIVGYRPPANDRRSLLYRPHGSAYDGSHLIKTNVRGDHGQHPDRVLIKRQRRLERDDRRSRPKAKIRGLSFQQARCRLRAQCSCSRAQRKRCEYYPSMKRAGPPRPPR